MLLELLLFELRYHFKHISSLAFALCFLLLGYLFSRNAFGEPNLYHNSTYNITLATGILSLAAIFCMMILAGRVLLRDRQYQMEELVYATPVAKLPFLAGRFSGFLLTSVLLFSFSLLGLWLGVLLPGAGEGKIGPIAASQYLWPLLVLVVPNLLLGGVVLFTIASLTRNTLATYVGGIFLYGLYWLTAMFLNSPLMAASTPASPEGLAVAALLDPFGLSAFFEQTRYWEIAQKNAALVTLNGHFLYNRLLWTAVSGLLLLGNYWWFSFRKGILKPKGPASTVAIATKRLPQSEVPPIHLSKHPFWAQLWSNFSIEIRQLFSSKPFWLMLLIWAGVVLSEILTRIYGGGEYGTDLYPTTNLMIWLYADPFLFLSILLLIFYAGEITHREKELVMHELKDSLPVKNLVFWLSKYLTLISIPVVLIGSAVLLAIICQLSKGWFIVEPLQYLASFYLLGVPAMLFAVVALLIQTLAPNKYVGLFFCLLFQLLLTSSLSESIGIVHPLLKVGAFPPVEYSNMNGFSTQLQAFNWLVVYWGSLYLFFAYLTYQLWRRGTVTTLTRRIRNFSHHWSPRATLFTSLCLAIFLAAGSYIFYNINHLNHYQSRNAQLDERADYEKKYKAFVDLPELSIVDLKTEVALYPAQRAYRMEQVFTLQNKTEKVVEQVWFTASPGTRVCDFKLSQAKRTQFDSIHQVYWFVLDAPLLPGEQLQMEYHIEDNHQGFKMNASPREMEIVSNGTNIMNVYTTPSFGYSYSREITDQEERQKRGLAPLEEERDELHAGATEKEGAEYDKFNFETTISTDRGQIALAPGNLVAQWEENGRNFFHYKTAQPINNFYSYLSAGYQVQQKEYPGISLEVYYSPGHDYNVKMILEEMAHTLDYCQRSLTPYPLDHLRLAEIPSYWPMGGYATAGLIALVEDRSFFTDLRDSTHFDVVTKRVAHEVAHQWFGHQLTPQMGEGASMLVESFAKYIECVIIDEQYGKGQLRTLLQSEMTKYFSNRNRSDKPEPALDRVDDQSFIYYSKGGVVMNALRDLLGEEALNEVISVFIRQHGYPHAKGSAADFVQLLKACISTDLHPQIDDWVSGVLLYDIKVESVTHQQLADGRYEVTVVIEATKSRATKNGQLQDMPLAEDVTIGFFQQHPDQLGRNDQAIYLGRHALTSGRNELTFELDVLPKFVAVDPFLNLLDKNVIDNIEELE